MPYYIPTVQLWLCFKGTDPASIKTLISQQLALLVATQTQPFKYLITCACEQVKFTYKHTVLILSYKVLYSIELQEHAKKY